MNPYRIVLGFLFVAMFLGTGAVAGGLKGVFLSAALMAGLGSFMAMVGWLAHKAEQWDKS